MTYFDQIDPINDIFDQSYVNKPDWHNVSKGLEQKCFDHFPQISTYDVILPPPKMTQYWPFSQKITYFDQIYPINDIFDQSYVNKLDWHNVSKF